MYQQEYIYQQENIYQQEYMHQQENMYQQKDQLNIFDEDSDTESFNFNEEDNEYYSDYNNEEHDNEKDNEENNEENDNEDNKKDDDDNDDENDEDNDAMHIDNVDKTNIPIEGLKLLYLKSLYNFTESAYNDIMKVFITSNISLYKVKKYLKEITELVPVFYDMCENSCICYTEKYESYQSCPICDSTRLDSR